MYQIDFKTAHKAVITALSMVAIIAGGGARAEITFERGQFLTQTQFDVFSTAVADFNGDGNLDVAVAAQYDVYVLLGKEDGSFSEGPQSGSVYLPHYLVTGDFNGDGKMDIAAGNQDDRFGSTKPSYSILLNQGGGAFDVKAPVDLPGEVAFIRAGDVNGDGKTDLVTTNNGGSAMNSVGVFLSNGDGTFGDMISYTIGTAKTPATSLALADFDGDGHLDMAVTLGTLWVLLNTGDGAFQSGVEYPVGGDSVTAADFTGDGTLDLAVKNAQERQIQVLPGVGEGAFGPAWIAAAAAAGDPFFVKDLSLNAADLNGDGKTDLVAMASEGGNYEAENYIGFLLGNGDGTFGPLQLTYFSGRLKEISPADFNGDNRADLVLPQSRSAQVLFNKVISAPLPSAALGAITSYNVGYHIANMVAADLDGDGKVDLIGSSGHEPKILILAGKGDGSFPDQLTYNPGTTLNFLVAEDFNGDGKIDLAGTSGGNWIPPFISVFFGKGDGSFEPFASYAQGVATSFLKSGDLNKDGKPDLIFSGGHDTNWIEVLFNRGDGTFLPPIKTTAGMNISDASIGDVNGDGAEDIITLNSGSSTPNSGGPTFSVLLNNGDGTFKPPADYPVSKWLTQMDLADFNGDGKQDLVGSSYGDPAGFTLILGSGDGVFNEPPRHLFLSSSLYNRFVTGDFNDDGKADLAGPGIIPGYNDGTFANTSSIPVLDNNSSNPLVTADFNGDGKLDFANSNNFSQVLIRLNETPGLTVTTGTALAKAGDRIRLTAQFTRAPQSPPTAIVTGDCVEATPLSLVSWEESGTIFSGTYVVPPGADCDVTFTAYGSHAITGASLSASTQVLLDRTGPTTTATLYGSRIRNGMFSRGVTVNFYADDLTSGAAALYYALDTVECTPETPAGCTVLTGNLKHTPVIPLTDTDGPHTLTYFSQDKAGNMETRKETTFVINKTLPVAEDQQILLDEDTAREITLVAANPMTGEPPMTFAVVQAPLHGTLGAMTENRVTYTPDPNYYGPDEFTFKAVGATEESNVATVTLTVRAVNDPPVVTDREVTILKGVSKEVRLGAADVEGSAILYSLLEEPEHGTLTVLGLDRVLYTPAADFEGSDRFAYKANDGQLDSSTATVTLAVTPPLLSFSSAQMPKLGSSTLTLTSSASLTGLSSLELELRPVVPQNAPDLLPAFTPGEHLAGGSVAIPPELPWSVTLFAPAGATVSGKAELLRLKVILAALEGAADGMQYRIEVEKALARYADGSEEDVTDRVLPGLLTVGEGCAGALRGDASGEGSIDVRDAVRVLQVAVEIIPVEDECQRSAMDVDCDGSVGVGDAVRILRNIVLQEPFPDCSRES